MRHRLYRRLPAEHTSVTLQRALALPELRAHVRSKYNPQGLPLIPSIEALLSAADLMRRAQYAVVLTGAGISTGSGIPDFRSHKTGMWDHVDPMEVASIFGFRHKPEAFFEWVRPLTRQIINAQPNPAHIALAQLEE